MERATNQPFGAHAPNGWMRRLIRTSRRCSESWSGKRAAFALRAVGVRSLRGAPLDIESLGARMRLYPSQNVAEKKLLFTPQYFDAAERAFLASRLTDGFTFIDVGANVGGYALFVAARAGPGARILAVEPQPDLFERLTYNIALNPFASVKAFNCALADRDGEITLFTHPTNKGEASMRMVNGAGGGEQIRVPAKALDTLLAEEGIGRVDALKIDVEGAEDLILEPFFRTAVPALWPRVLVVEHAPARWSTDLPALILECGYRIALRARMNVVYERA